MGVPLLVVGAGGFARETVEAVHAINGIERRWDLMGFLDDDPALHGTEIDGTPVLGPTTLVHEHPDARVVVCTGSPKNNLSRRNIVRRLALPALRYATLVHPAACLAESTRIGPGTILLASVVTTTSVWIGSHVAVMPGVIMTHDDVVKDFATFGAGVRLSGTVTIGEGTYLGAGCVVRENLSVGAWSLIGMGSVVTKDVPDEEVWVGAPARRLRSHTHSGKREQPAPRLREVNR
jgi:sugar O-acyltransferase (sialic acid O-acetyltransferase NeuD family)